MGLFFDEDEPKKSQEVANTNKQSDAVTVIVGGIVTLFIILVTWFLKMLSAILLPFLTWAFTIEGRTKEQLRTQAVTILSVFGLLFFFVYRIPYWRDFISLSSSHTTNINNGLRVLFPDRSYFSGEGEKKVLRFEEVGNVTYFTYPGYSERVAGSLEPNMCQLIPRGEKLLISSRYLPRQAIGFDENVMYSVTKKLTELDFLRYMRVMFMNPSYSWKGKDYLSTIQVTYDETTSWKDFTENWYNIPTMKGSSYKWFEVQAKSNEHAILCI